MTSKECLTGTGYLTRKRYVTSKEYLTSKECLTGEEGVFSDHCKNDLKRLTRGVQGVSVTCRLRGRRRGCSLITARTT